MNWESICFTLCAWQLVCAVVSFNRNRWEIYSKHSNPGTASNVPIPLRKTSLMKQIQSATTQEPIKPNQPGCMGLSWTSACTEILLGSNQNQNWPWAAGLHAAAIFCICGASERNHGSLANHTLILKHSPSHCFSSAFVRTETHFPDSVNQTLTGRAAAQ